MKSPQSAVKDPEAVRAYCEKKVREVLKATAGQPEIDILLALGAACPYAGRKRHCEIWLSVIRHLRGETEEDG